MVSFGTRLIANT